jgi:hypothetical protein
MTKNSFVSEAESHVYCYVQTKLEICQFISVVFMICHVLAVATAGENIPMYPNGIQLLSGIIGFLSAAVSLRESINEHDGPVKSLDFTK